MKITSPAFENGGVIPPKHTADGENISPPLVFENVPGEAKSLALISDDPDAPMGDWVHWIIYDMKPEAKGIEAGAEPDGVLGRNSFGKLPYGGPAPPSGTHRYFFKLYALDTELGLAEGATKKQLLEAMKGHIIEKSELVGKYSRL